MGGVGGGVYPLVKISNHVFLTEEKLPMVLISKVELVSYFNKCGMITNGDIIEYERVVTTGKRSVMRGVFRKV